MANPKKVARRILGYIYSFDDDFIVYWKRTRKKGKRRFILSETVITIIALEMVGLYFFITGKQVLGYEKEEILLYNLVMGIISGVISSSFGWKYKNRRYDKLKEKALKQKWS